MCGGAAAGRTGVGEGGRAGRGPGTGTADGEPRATTVNRKNKLFLFGRSVPVSRPSCMSLINSSALAARAAAITLSSLQFFSP